MSPEPVPAQAPKQAHAFLTAYAGRLHTGQECAYPAKAGSQDPGPQRGTTACVVKSGQGLRCSDHKRSGCACWCCRRTFGAGSTTSLSLLPRPAPTFAMRLQSSRSAMVCCPPQLHLLVLPTHMPGPGPAWSARSLASPLLHWQLDSMIQHFWGGGTVLLGTVLLATGSLLYPAL